jgi:hypothetical protein
MRHLVQFYCHSYHSNVLRYLLFFKPKYPKPFGSYLILSRVMTIIAAVTFVEDENKYSC